MNLRIYLLAVGTFALGTDAFVVAGVLPKIGADLGVSVSTAGWVVTLFSLTYGLGAPLLAALTGRIPRHRLLLGALVVFSLANVFSAIAPNFEILLLTRILAGTSAALYSPTAYFMATSLSTPQKRGQALATVVAGLTISTVLGVPLGTWIGQSFNWRITFGLVALLGGVALGVLALTGIPRIANPPSLGLRARLAPISQPRVLLALLPVLIWSAGTFILYTYITPFLQQTTHLQDTGGLLLAYGLGTVVGNWSAGLAVDRFGSLPTIASLLVLMIITLGLLPLGATSLWGAIPLLFLWSFSGWGVFPSQQHRLLALFPQSANVILALNNSAFYLGGALGTATGGLVLSGIGTGGLSWVGAAFEVVALGGLLLGPNPVRLSRQESETELVPAKAEA
jgi:predicted MFS family arabinose efflux permease